MNIEQGISNDEVRNTSIFEIPCSIFEIKNGAYTLTIKHLPVKRANTKELK